MPVAPFPGPLSMKTAPPESRRSAEPIPARVAPSPAPAAPARPLPPQLPPAGGRTRWWVWLLIVVVAAGLAALLVHRIHSVRAASAASSSGSGGGGRRGGGGPAHDLPVVVATARRGDLPVYLWGLGNVTPLKTVDLLTRVDGVITKINYTEGQHVKAGDFLLQIDARPYQAVLDQAKGQLAKDQATLDSAKWNVQQDQLAMKDRSIAEQQLHTDTATRDSTIGAIAVDQANIEAAQVNLDYCHITSPIDGTIGLRLVDVGNIVHAAGTTSLAVIAQETPISVVFTLVEDELEQLQRRMNTGQPVRVDAYDRDKSHRLARGTLLALDSTIDPTTASIKIKAQFDNADHALFPSQFVNARVLVDTVRGAVLVPTAAVQHNATGAAFVYVVENGDTVKARPVTTGAAALSAVDPGETDTSTISSGLEPGDVVVTNGVDKLVDGTKVSPHAETEGGGRRGGATRPTTAAGEPMDQTGVGGPQMDRPDAGGGRPGATGGATTRPFGHHRRPPAGPVD